MFDAFLKVNMTNPMPFVAVAAVVCEFHRFIYIYICMYTVTIGKSR
jgi:hypothetical protein